MRKFLAIFLALIALVIDTNAQTKTVTGRVTDMQNLPVPFSSVRIKGGKQGVPADAEGNFAIKAKPGDILVISGTGITTKEVPVTDQTNLIIQVTRKESNLTEVVVTALGIKKEAKAVGYSTATVNSEVLNVAKPVNVAQGLMGQVSGAQISIINNGVDPQIRVQLRGERHIVADNQPLFIVDGMEVRSDFIITINPEDIDNVSILKGASAAALYGSEASNGVVLITTKKGTKNGKPVINLTQTGTLEKLAYFPKLQTTYSGYGGEQGVFLAGTPYQFNATNPYTGFTNYIPFENQQYGPPFDGNAADGFIGIPNADGKVDSVPFAPQSKDPRKQFFQTGNTSQTDVSISGGDSKNSNFLGLQFVNVNGTVPKDQSQRASVRFGGKRTYGIFSYDFTMNYAYKYSNTVGNDITAGWPIYWTLLNTPANIPIGQLKNWWDPNSFGNLSNYYNAYYINPWWQVDNSRNITKQDNLQGVFSANLKPTSWFTATYRLGAQVSNTVNKYYRNAATFSPYAIAANAAPIYGTPASGNIAGAEEDDALVQRRIQQDIFLTFQKNFGDLSATLILGNTIWDRYSNEQVQGLGAGVGNNLSGLGPQTQTSGLILPGIYNIDYGYGIPLTGSPITSSGGIQGVSDNRLISGYGDLTLGYHDFLFVHGNYRRDYSSLLASGHNNYSVWAVDASWIFSDNIAALKNSTVLSYGKLRGAYSQTGQITLSPYATVNTFGVPSPFPYGGLAALALNGTYNNPANVPEATKEKEVGVELGFLKSRITAGATYYYDDNSNQLFQVGLTNATGFSSAFVNAARTASTGWEFDLKVSPVRTKDMRWDIGANLAIQTTTVKALYGSGANQVTKTNMGNSNEAIVGMSMPQMYVSDVVRDSTNGKVVVNSQGYPQLAGTPVAAGRTTPKYILGLTSTFTYKDFTIQVIGDYRGGYVFFNSAEQNLDFTGASAHSATNGRQNFIYPNSEVLVNGKYQPNTNVYTQDGNLGFWVSSQYRSAGTSYVENAAAWKIRTISLTYDFTRLLGTANVKVFKGVKLTVLCNNVAMFRPKENDFTDPEFNASNNNGLGYNTYYQLPPTRQFTGVLSFTF
jgi:TonB-linked SusC/RagA family outer membrane protein